MFDQKSEIVYDKDFLKDVRKLPVECQNKLAELLKIIESDAFDAQLHTKPLSPPLQGLFSFRIIRDYRVGFKFRSDHIIQLLAADRRDKIYKRLKNKV
ncbi:hypothetical protein A2W54_04035 [Candidatus Giovannonibacteria bacterium RIFCSPHIGHO2_02_43_13]|uniref:Plasmid stabilization protein n=1 Tax=Candidatus Giovannonibacteria bacterium RIFCSPHIGHO2_02_43_13 TaxID=1798330 RepID=A0A1F5WS52_9BACT|nr:MAG: hypothetical protein A2W54_04035 [Candidatus Giovannonibacteria bacterium RIFCSPHIGHO2_02_43_13]OGF89270.1 MAG: hypothetical protein A3I94_02900 [Candidatus Giovannonibacteria bacterium RIFCSPLOWO2_02_FULL_43_54]